MWKGKFLLVESVFEDTKTRSGFVKRETDATQIFIGRHGKAPSSQLQTDRNLIWQYDIFVLSL
jgi:hypothetical protein